MNPLLLVGIMSLLLVALIAWTAHRLTGGRSQGPRDDHWWEEFSPDRYRPMTRLLSLTDEEWLKGAAGSTPEMVRSWRSRRMSIFRQYLREMTVDFEGLQAVGQAMVVSGSVGPEFQEKLFRHQVMFTRNLWMVRGQLILFRFGLTDVDASGLLEALRGASQVYQAAPAAA